MSVSAPSDVVLARAAVRLSELVVARELLAGAARTIRLVPDADTHLSFREIAERTYVSAKTVKTQANAVYRKFDVSCRSDAVARARRLGLLDA